MSCHKKILGAVSIGVRACIRAGRKAARVVAIAAWAVMLGTPAEAVAAPDYRFHPQVLELVEKLHDVLIAHNVCVTRQACTAQQIVFASPEPWGISAEVYGVADGAILQELSTVFSSAFFKSQMDMSMEWRIYAVTKAQALDARMFNKPKPVREVRWQNYDAHH